MPSCAVCLVSVTFVYCAETANDTTIVAMECKYETIPKISKCTTIFNDFE